MTPSTFHICGGTILSGGVGDQSHCYCDRCGAFVYGTDPATVPSGTDRDANRAAYDAGDESSPSA